MTPAPPRLHAGDDRPAARGARGAARSWPSSAPGGAASAIGARAAVPQAQSRAVVDCERAGGLATTAAVLRAALSSRRSAPAPPVTAPRPSGALVNYVARQAQDRAKKSRSVVCSAAASARHRRQGTSSIAAQVGGTARGEWSEAVLQADARAEGHEGPAALKRAVPRPIRRPPPSHLGSFSCKRCDRLVGAPASRSVRRWARLATLAAGAVVDTHAHLGLCEPAGPALVAAAREAGVRAILTVGLGEDSNPARRAAAAHEEVFACVGRHPNGADGFDEQAAAEAIEALGGDRGGRGRGDRPRLLPRPRRPRAAARLRGADRDRAATGKPLVIHLRDRTVDDGGRRPSPPWPPRDGGRGDPALLSRPGLGGRGRRARLVLLVRRQRHLPEGRAAARGRAAGPRRAAPGRDRLALPRAAAGARQAEPARQRGRHGRAARRGAGRRLRGARGLVEATPRGSSAGEPAGPGRGRGASARTSSPTRTCSRRSCASGPRAGDVVLEVGEAAGRSASGSRRRSRTCT